MRLFQAIKQRAALLVMLALLAFNTAGLFENNWGDTEVQRVVLFVLALPFCLAAAERSGAAAPAPAA